MEQKTGIGVLFTEFSRGYEAEISLISPEFLSVWTYN